MNNARNRPGRLAGRWPRSPNRRWPPRAAPIRTARHRQRGLFTDYRFRGISQTHGEPALQGGVDYAHKSGLYVGNWNSNVEARMYSGAQPRDGLLRRLQEDLRRLA